MTCVDASQLSVTSLPLQASRSRECVVVRIRWLGHPLGAIEVRMPSTFVTRYGVGRFRTRSLPPNQTLGCTDLLVCEWCRWLWQNVANHAPHLTSYLSC